MIIPAVRIDFSDDDIERISLGIRQVLRSGRLTLGEKTRKFEEECAAMAQRKFAVAVNSGTTALEILLRAYNVRDKVVIAPANTNYATVAAIIFAGGIPKLVDSGLYTPLNQLKRLVFKTRNVAGVIVVHIGGYISSEIAEIADFCRSRKIFLLEDAAHAHGASLNGVMAGSFGDSAAFSFFPTKVVTSGEGGVIVTDSETIQRKALIFRDQGKSMKTGKNIFQGNSWRMSEFNAVVGLCQLKSLKHYVSERNKVMHLYDSFFGNLKDGIEICKRDANLKPSGYKYIVMLRSQEQRVKISKLLKNEYDISLSGDVYDSPINEITAFSDCKLSSEDGFPIAEKFCKTHICLPLWPKMKYGEVEYVFNSILDALKKAQY